ncbi:peptidyl-prolyl cis-trans isomerase [Myxococcus sp. K15C18031901]|uniref:peptidylprolyl isomerase n=1 Tax=Myxococcus dinghuensis TaxID=2906761 RepID=UPI0020A82A22|nr:peptidyl-prolyl cis-trans isomerase [Myxococcus dinghuensis]MCP3101727.1 peptidyl-prolyl cis-trans isomerase [Myxococcus dinghuensis]
MNTRTPSLLVAVVSLLSFAGCNDGAPRASEQAANQGPVVAIVNDRALTTQEVKAKLDEQPQFVRGRYNTLEKKKEFLENLIRFELLLQEAKRQGLEKDPEVLATLEKVLVQRLMRKQQETAGGAIDDAAVRKHYEDHLSEFVKPERVRLNHILIEAPKGDAAKRAQARTAAVKLLADIKAKETGGTKGAFELAAAEQSQDATTKSAGGDLGFHSYQELVQAWGTPFADAAFALNTISDLGQVVETDKGFHLVKLQGRQLGMNQPLEQARGRIEARLTAEQRAKAMEGLVDTLRAKAKIEIKDDALQQLSVEGVSLPSPAAGNH